ncbi:MAG: Yip1 family protein [Candidatus Anstonellaceae archaeon]
MGFEERFKQAWGVFLSPEKKFPALATKEASLLYSTSNFALAALAFSLFFIIYAFSSPITSLSAPHEIILSAIILFVLLLIFQFIFIGILHLCLKLFGSTSSFSKLFYVFSLIALWAAGATFPFLLLSILSELVSGILSLFFLLPALFGLYVFFFYQLYQFVVAAMAASGLSSLKVIVSLFLSVAIIIFLVLVVISAYAGGLIASALFSLS